MYKSPIDITLINLFEADDTYTILSIIYCYRNLVIRYIVIVTRVTPLSFYDAFTIFLFNFRYGGIDLNARRKNATRETTNTLKAWLYEHRKNPYPTKGEKIMLAIITKMTLTQVSTWFANARRRLKKENKMTWSPRNRSDDGTENEDMDDDFDNKENAGERLSDENSNKIDNDHSDGRKYYVSIII
jgi:hypothetical protein